MAFTTSGSLEPEAEVESVEAQVFLAVPVLGT